MQDRYTGDIGDFFKYALMRRLVPCGCVGLAWWLDPDEGHNADGKHTAYLDCPERWRWLDPALFDGLTGIVGAGQRHTAAIAASGLLPGVAFSGERLAHPGGPPKGVPGEPLGSNGSRRTWRAATSSWRTRITGCGPATGSAMVAGAIRSACRWAKLWL